MMGLGGGGGGEAGEVVALLEGGAGGAQLHALYATVREPWLARGLLAYHTRTGSARALDLLARAPDPHVKHLLDALAERLRAGERAPALRALAHLVARRPPWLHRLSPHTLLRDVVRTLRPDAEPAPLLNALLALAALLPAAPAPLAPLLADLTDAFAKLAAAAPTAPAQRRDHLLLGLRALFHGLYATHPCTMLDFLRHEYGPDPDGDAFRLTVLPMVESVRLHPALITGSRRLELGAGRSALDPDLFIEAPPVFEAPDGPAAPSAARAVSPAPATAAVPGSGAHASLGCAAIRPGADGWFPLVERCGAESAPHTPLPAAEPGASPPEAAVEATPENTPVKEPRTQFSFPTDTGTARALSRPSQPPSPLGSTGPDTYGGRLARVVLDRVQADAAAGGRRSRPPAPDSPVPMGGAPPPLEWPIARPEPNRPAHVDASTAARPSPAHAASPADALNIEDREVLELTGGGPTAGRAERTERTPAERTPRPRHSSGGPAPGGPLAPSALARTVSCPALRERAPRTHTAATQTIDAWPEPYEALLADLHRRSSDTRVGTRSDVAPVETVRVRADKDVSSVDQVLRPASGPCERLDSYLSRMYGGSGGAGGAATSRRELAEQLELTHAQLMYERWRREAHGERNRRLLGRCRQARATDLQNSALVERVRTLQRERDDLAQRLRNARPSRHADFPPDADRFARLETELAAERASRERAEATLRDAETRRARDAAETQRLRAEAFELRRRLESASRAAAVGERRAEHVRRLRRELLILGEREARLAESVGAAGARVPAATERMVRHFREEAGAARAEAAEAVARAETSAAREAELEATLMAREVAIVELKRQARDAAQDHAARLEAVQDKYRALMHVLRRMETRRLEQLAGAVGGAGAGGSAGAGAASPQSSPLSASLTSDSPLAAQPALAELSRVRHLLEDESAADPPPPDAR